MLVKNLARTNAYFLFIGVQTGTVTMKYVGIPKS